MTSLLLVQYIALAIVPAIVSDTPGLNLMLSVVGAATITSLVLEAVFSPLGFTELRLKRISPSPVIAIAVVGLLSGWLASFFGAGSYRAQIGSSVQSPMAALFTPLQGGALIGLTLLLYLTKHRMIAYRTGMVLVGAGLLVELLRGIYLAILGPSIAFVFAVGMTAWLLGLVSWRWFLAGLLFSFLAWPAVYAFRNDRRIDFGTSAAEISRESPVERFFQDENFSQIRLFDPPVEFYGSPGMTDILRFGLIPRFLDRTRPALNSGAQLSLALGGTSRSSASATLLGGAYLTGGWPGLVIFILIVTIALAFATRSPGPWGLVASALLIKHFLWIGSTYPDAIAAFLQAALFALLAAFALSHWRPARKVSPRVSNAVSMEIANNGAKSH